MMLCAPSVPGNTRASRLDKSRIQSLTVPSAPMAVKASRVPSGESPT